MKGNVRSLKKCDSLQLTPKLREVGTTQVPHVSVHKYFPPERILSLTHATQTPTEKEAKL
eukprot:scaffold13349_cov195-Skeletonema_marinoi.AAC.2